MIKMQGDDGHPPAVVTLMALRLQWHRAVWAGPPAWLERHSLEIAGSVFEATVDFKGLGVFREFDLNR
jgi:hypothetical protein